MGDALIVLGCLAAGYAVGWMRTELRHMRKCEALGSQLESLAKNCVESRRTELLLIIAGHLKGTP